MNRARRYLLGAVFTVTTIAACVKMGDWTWNVAALGGSCGLLVGFGLYISKRPDVRTSLPAIAAITLVGGLLISDIVRLGFTQAQLQGFGLGLAAFVGMLCLMVASPLFQKENQ